MLLSSVKEMKALTVFLRSALFSSLLLLSGCTWQPSPVPSESMKGTGTTKTYSASYQAVWDNTLQVVDGFGMKIKKEEKDRGYLEVSTYEGSAYRMQLFVEPLPSGTGTQLEVASQEYRVFGDFENQIHKNVGNRLKDPSWETVWTPDTPYYIKLSFLYPARGERLPLHMTYEDGDAVAIEPENGGGVSLDLGYQINKAFSAEVAFGSESYGTSNCFPRCDTSEPGYREGYFDSDFVAAALLYHFYRSPFAEAHIGGGVEYHFSAELTRSSDTVDTVVSYDNTMGYHVGIGGSMGRDLFLFLDLNYAFGFRYHYDQIKENSVVSAQIYPEWKEVRADGFYTSFGIGYRF